MFEDQNQNTNVPNNLPTMPNGPTKEPEDMFAGVEMPAPTSDPGSMPDVSAKPSPATDALSSGLLKKKDTVVNPPLTPPSEDMDFGNYKMSEPILGKILLFIVIIAFLGVLVYAGWWVLYSPKNSSVNKSAQPAAQTNNQVQPPPPANPSTPVNSSTSIPTQMNNDQILFGQGVDSDKDGLDDVREKEIGTNPQNPDTDNDGLTDGDEVIIYKTNPLNPDTDGDGLSDGDEILIWKTNPLNPDTDGDGYPDGTEVKNGYNPLGPGKLFNVPSKKATSTTSTP